MYFRKERFLEYCFKFSFLNKAFNQTSFRLNLTAGPDVLEFMWGDMRTRAGKSGDW